MLTEYTQLKINLPVSLKEFLESKAAKFGVTMANYVKHLIIEDVKKMEYPSFEPSERTIRAYINAKKEFKAGKTIPVNDINKFFDEL